jgi:hypothetical protein
MYMASYSVNSNYAYHHGFLWSSLTPAPPVITQASEGLYCYAAPDCQPNKSFQNSNYWVSPLWGYYTFTGFDKPVDNGIWNKAKAGSAIPVKFGLGGNHGTTGILKSGFPTVTKVLCTTGGEDGEAKPAVSNGFTYDAASDQYNYVWKTDKGLRGQCHRFDLGLIDGSTHIFNVQFT